MGINRNIEDLNENFRKKLKLFLNEAKLKGYDIVVFEGLRSLERQKELYAQGRTTPGKIVTWTLKSNHLSGNAADIVFLVDGNYSWSGDYDSLIEIAKKYGINNLKPTETCHFEDDGTLLSKLELMRAFENLTGYKIFTASDEDYETPATIGDVKDLLEVALYRRDKKKEEGTLEVREKKETE